ncbi:enoyl-CoA hydratase/isomerase family protein [Arthrobacter sp. ISL-85]|uniref:enoyl-CoA hydratase/isomerase family protein n=1 Tax=Arthrobacter sp. ISL-85 TaxID=2819115 RepID=UPI001BE8B7D8|nr:enoyl-CoA hydratase-related protein [Arthrobacter sp. ISL-85]MBT2565233.1 enoyl-CoA hydratase/isomerase family protein [Arthrobacter sp. ISL-85]
MTELRVDRPAVGVLRCRLDGPDTLNALDDPVKRALVEQIVLAATEPEVRVLMLTGAGRAFCSGGDIRGMGQRTPAEMNRVLTYGRQITEGLSNLQKPVVAAVNGIASGAGFNLALACDLILAAPQAWFQQSFVKMGLLPDMGGTYLLAQSIGLHRAKEAVLTMRRFSAHEGKQLGFVAEVLDGQSFDDQAVAYCATLSQRAPLAMGLTKFLTNSSVDGTLGDALDREGLAQGVLAATEDHKRAVSTFQSKGDLDAIEFTGN